MLDKILMMRLNTFSFIHYLTYKKIYLGYTPDEGGRGRLKKKMRIAQISQRVINIFSNIRGKFEGGTLKNYFKRKFKTSPLFPSLFLLKRIPVDKSINQQRYLRSPNCRPLSRYIKILYT